MNTENKSSIYVTEVVIDRTYLESLPVDKRQDYVLKSVVKTISDAAQSGALRGEGSCNPLVEILKQARDKSGIVIPLSLAMRQYRLNLERASA